MAAADAPIIRDHNSVVRLMLEVAMPRVPASLMSP